MEERWGEETVWLRAQLKPGVDAEEEGIWRLTLKGAAKILSEGLVGNREQGPWAGSPGKYRTPKKTV